MTEKLITILTPIKEQTGLEIDVYALSGERVASTDDEGERLLKVLPDVSARSLVQDKVTDTTAFRLEVLGKTFVGAIAGSGEVSKNYATLVAGLVESAMENLGQTMDKAGEYRLMLEGEYTRVQYERFCSRYPGPQEYYVLVFFTGAKMAVLRDYLKDLCQDKDIVIQTDRTTLVMLKDASAAENEYHSAAEFAHMVCENVNQELGMRLCIGVGEPTHTAEDLRVSYEQAFDAVRYGKMLGDSGQVFYVKDYLVAGLFESLPTEKLLSTLRQGVTAEVRAIFEDKEMMETAEQFMLGSLNISETARVMYMHRNTLIYRLDKIEKATGLNLRLFSDAMTFRLLSMLYKLQKTKKD